MRLEIAVTPFFPFQFVRVAVNTTIMLSQAQTVIALRMMGMAGFWSVTPAENTRMVQEKLRAGLQAGMAVQHAMLTGKTPVEVAEAALRPVARVTASNSRRLMKRGPTLPS
ncbi:hypothetical protein SAMN06265221_1534 [Paracoccus laeviglucosivorans]|uniref:Antifreeze protein n=1 Tax=Paracoccus laeviglucosivorans TaxID=1197861 RepID=A0A521FUT9_9RHOB|nr:hypothetical protein SAMN06265221_1534 [Paracoccus laeviglucosivorans]